MPILTKKQASRKFVDLIHRAATIWANWQPSVRIELGSYGVIDKETGAFLKKGSIFSDPDPEIQDIIAKYPPILEAPIDKYEIASFDAKKVDVSPTINLTVFGVAEPMLGGQWKFGRRRGAVLLTYQPQVKRLSDELLEELKNKDWCRGKFIVTQVYSCPAYALYLSEKKGETIAISLQASTPVPGGADPGAGIQARWVRDGAFGTYQQAYLDQPVYDPLFQMKEIAKVRGRRDRLPSQVSEDEIEWAPTKAPWGALDDDGEEMPSDDEDPDLA